MIRSPVPATLVTGATGAGKTAFVLRLLERRPQPERWAVVVNDFGRGNMNDAAGVNEGAVVVREVAGCICCTAQVTLRTAVVSLLRETAPARLLLEASAAAEPDALLRLLRERPLANAVAVQSVVCVVHPDQVADARYALSPLYRAQIAGADCVLIAGEVGAPAEAATRSAVEKVAGRSVRFATLSDLT